MTQREIESKLINRFKKILLFSGIFNVIAGFPFVFPWTIKWYNKLLIDINQSLNLGGVVIPLSSLLLMFRFKLQVTCINLYSAFNGSFACVKKNPTLDSGVF